MIKFECSRTRVKKTGTHYRLFAGISCFCVYTQVNSWNSFGKRKNVCKNEKNY